MQKYIAVMHKLLAACPTEKIRYLYHKIDWDKRLIGILGDTGTGKTTLMLQYIQLHYAKKEGALYLSLDEVFPPDFSIYNLAQQFYRQGGQHLFLDEVHKYPAWMGEVKKIYKDFPSLKLVFAGTTEILMYCCEYEQRRRATMHQLRNLSFREFILFKTDIRFDAVGLQEIFENHVKLAQEINKKINPLTLFDEYMKFGVYPNISVQPAQYKEKVMDTLKTNIEAGFPPVITFDDSGRKSIQSLMSMIAGSVPYRLNMAAIKRETGFSRDVLINILDLMVKSNLILFVSHQTSPECNAIKPYKINLHNASMIWAFSPTNEADADCVYKTFFVNQLDGIHQTLLTDSADFFIDNKYRVAIGGHNMRRKKFLKTENTFVLDDQIETGHSNIVPLWLFGFLY